jgi:hypothetical protein
MPHLAVHASGLPVLIEAIYAQPDP